MNIKKQMVDYCHTSRCLRKHILEYFGEGKVNSMLQVKGVGENKLARFGEEFLNVIRQHGTDEIL